MKLKNKQAFTLVELIVTITILVILATIAFISFTGYSKNSRDSKRIADINSIQKSLELYITEKGTYPIPDNNANITYSGATAWIEGTVGDGVMINMKNINKKPLDPLTENEYTYSITSAKTEYQLGAISEGGQMGYNLPINQTHAATEKKATAMIRGTYNEKYLKVQSGTINRILALPSIIATDISQTELLNILSSKKLVYNSYNNIPHSYNNAGYIMDGGFDYTNTTPQVYSGSMKTLTDDNEEKKIFISGLKSAYNGTILQGEANYKDIINSDITTNSTGAINTVISFINSNVGGIRVSNTVLPITSITNSLVSGPCINLPINGLYYNGTTNYTLELSDLGTTLNALTAGYNSSPTINTCQWKCNTGYTYSGSTCLQIINGLCGSDNGTDMISTPTNLCSAGNSTTITDGGVGGLYEWSCIGTNGGTDQSCSAAHSVNWNDGINYFTIGNLITYNETSSGLSFNGPQSTGIGYCNNLVLGGKDDWLMPTRDELPILYNNRNLIGGFMGGISSRYWTSYTYGTQAGAINFRNGYKSNTESPTVYHYVHCVRHTN